ncbi:MAG: hypothetical protein J1E16_00660 [Muribaculaceae bacterium]|nr:hypothetical protein [Muribaculaceae bacterium]
MDEIEKEKWNQRHFFVCLAILTRVENDRLGMAKPISFTDVVHKADRIIALLQSRQQKQK